MCDTDEEIMEMRHLFNYNNYDDELQTNETIRDIIYKIKVVRFDETLNEIREIYNDVTDTQDVNIRLKSKYKNELEGFKELKTTKKI